MRPPGFIGGSDNLRNRPVEGCRVRGAGETAALLDVSDDSDDLAVLVGEKGQLEMVSNGVAVGPESFGHGLTDDDDGGGGGAIVGADIATLKEGDAHDFEVAWGNDSHGDFGLLGESNDGVSFDSDGLAGAAVKGQSVDGCGRLDSGD